MKKRNILWAVMLLAISMAIPFKMQATEVDAPIKTIFTKAISTQTQAGGWIEVYGEKKDLLGYVAYSKPYSNGIQGYNGETPLIIGFDNQKRIIAVQILENQETPQFLDHAKAGGLFNRWDKMTLKQALEANPDMVSGATYTSRSVIQSFNACINHLNEAGFVSDNKSKSGLFIVGGLFIGALLIVVVSRRIRRHSSVVA